MITRQQYLNEYNLKTGTATHRKYYAQFVNDEVKQRVLRYFPVDILKMRTHEE
jgi:hypothetical protein